MAFYLTQFPHPRWINECTSAGLVRFLTKNVALQWVEAAKPLCT